MEEEQSANQDVDVTGGFAGDVTTSTAEETGGISVLELYILYARHGGNEDEATMNA